MKEVLIGVCCIIGGIGFLFGFIVCIENFSAYMSKLGDEHNKAHCERAIEYHLYVPHYCTTDHLSGYISE